MLSIASGAIELGIVLRLALLFAGVLALCVPRLGATAPSEAVGGLPGFVHSSWTSKDGVPGMIQALAQGNDGFLWLGTGNGLYRFDGVSFDHVGPAPGHARGAIPVGAVLAARSGAIWVGYIGGGGVEIYRHGRMAQTGMPNPPGEITALREGSDGAIWAVSGRARRGLRRYADGKWQRIDSAWGVPDDQYVTSLLPARDGTIWVTTERTLLYLPRGARRFVTTSAQVAPGASLAEDRRGEIWLSDAAGTRMLPDYPAGATRPQRNVTIAPPGQVRHASILFDRAGNLWGTTFTGGVFAVDRASAAAPAPRARTFRTGDGLTSNQAVVAMEDREGNIWVGTELGLDQFRPANVSSAAMPPPGSAAGYMMTADTGGTVWFADGTALYRAMPGRPPEPVPGPYRDVEALCRGGGGSIWIGVRGAIVRLREGRAVERLALPGIGETFACAEDGHGRLWIARFGRGLLLRDGGGWRHIVLPAQGRPQDVVIDRSGNPVVILDRKTLVHIDGSIARAWTNDEIGVAGITSVYGGRDGLLVAGGEGLARWHDGRFQRLGIAAHPWLRGVRGIVETPDGQSWMINNAGILRIATDALVRAFAEPDRPLPHTLFDEQDGLSSRTQRNDGLQLAAGRDGRLWFLTRQGVILVDPARLVSNPAPPPVVIDALTVDGRRYLDPASLTLPSGTENLSIEYTGLSLTVPSRVRFRYRLEGVDSGWVDPGTRRQAFYTRLDPGTYRFRVIAANNDGVWNRSGATLTFTIPPTFTQSRAFAALCALAAVLLLWLLYRVRLHAMAGRMRMRMRERLVERERIARELHDTLLQGVQALVLRFQLVADDMSPEDPSRQALEQALDRADDVLAEGRDRVRDLRLIGGADDIAHMILEIARKQAFDAGVQLSIATEGEPRSLDPLVWDEVARIANEALFNIWRHAHARQVTIRIAFRPASFAVSFIDDGIGIDALVLSRGHREGHFGLPGMRERAAKIQAQLVVEKVASGGTEVRLVVPGAIAYSGATRPGHWRRLAMGGKVD